MIRLMQLSGGDDLSVPVTLRRERSARLSHRGSLLVMHREPAPAATTHDYVPVDGGRILVRLYRPHGRGPHPAYLFMHGGGWCEGTLDERDSRCRAICAGAGCLVASVDYRLAPENRYPTAPEDCYAALCWLVDNAERLEIDPDRLAVGGESSGGNLAAVICLMARDRSGPRPCYQWLDVPATDLTYRQSGFSEVPDGYGLDRAAIDELTSHYLSDMTKAIEPYCSPLLAEDLSELPPAWIMTAEFDQLRGDGEAYAAALNAAGVEARHLRLAGHVHASFSFTRLLASARAYQHDAIAALSAAFARPRP
jgi:acetyl esterase